MLNVNALEFFLHMFCYYIRSDTPPSSRSLTPDQNGNPAALAYLALFEKYLHYFLPLNNDTKPVAATPPPQHSPGADLHKMWNAFSSTTSHLLHSIPTVNPVQSPKPSLLNLKMLTTVNSPTAVAPGGHDVLGSQIWKSETVVHIVSAMLLDVNMPQHLLTKRKQSPSHIEAHFLPSIDLVRAVRVFVKHLHYFANSALQHEGVVNPQFHLSSNSLNELKLNVFGPRYLVQGKLYGFLRLCFENWPSDASFRMPLETWLSYIQPWRYTVAPDNSLSTSATEDNEPVIDAIDSKYKPFIIDNLLFYAAIFRQVLQRLQRVDLASSKNSFMLFRLAKVFNQADLKPIILEAEKVVMANARTPLIVSPKHRSNLYHSNVPLALLDYEEPNFSFEPLFGPQTLSLIRLSLANMRLVVSQLQDVIRTSTQEQERQQEQSVTAWIKTSLFAETRNDSFDDKILADQKKSVNHLQSSMTKLRDLFEISEQDIAATSVGGEYITCQRISPHARFILPTAETEADFATPKRLTERGRVQLLNRTCQPNLGYEGNPDEQPVRTYEVAFLVHLMIMLSNFINAKYGQWIIQKYNDQSVVGMITRNFVQKPTAYTKVEKSFANTPPRRTVVHLPPRVLFRFLASQQLLWTMSALVLSMQLLGYNIFTVTAVALLFIVGFMVSSTRS